MVAEVSPPSLWTDDGLRHFRFSMEKHTGRLLRSCGTLASWRVTWARRPCRLICIFAYGDTARFDRDGDVKPDPWVSRLLLDGLAHRALDDRAPLNRPAGRQLRIQTVLIVARK